MNVRKTSAVLSFVMLSGTVLAACSKDSGSGGASSQPSATGGAATATATAPSNLTDSGFPIVKDKITLKMMGVRAAIQGPWEQMDFFKEMETKTNIHFEFDTPPANSFVEKKNLAFASGDYPDVFFAANLTTAEEIEFGGQGILIPLEGLIEKHAPNLNKILQKYPEIKRSITSTDGHIYSLPQITELAHNLIPKVWINGDWMQKVGAAKAPTTVDELYALLKQFKDQDANGNGQADEVALSSQEIGGIRQMLLPAFGHLAGGSKTWDGIEVRGDKVVFVPIQEGYKQYLQYTNKLYAEKLLDNEIFTQTAQQYTAKGKENKVGVFYHAAPFVFLDIKKDEDNFKHPTMPALTSSLQTTPQYVRNGNITRGAFAITKKNKYPEATLRWVDYLYTDEGGILGNSGIEGKGWKWLDDAKTKWDRLTVDGKNVEEFRGQNTPDPGNMIPTFKSKELHYKINNPVTQWLHKVSEDYLKVAQIPYPLVYFTPEEQKRLNVLTTDISTYVNQMEAKLILEGTGGWDSYVDTIKKMNVDEMVKIYQAAYDRWKAAK